MKQWLFILMFLTIFVILGVAVSHAASFWNYFGGANVSANATANASGMYAPCPYTSTIPNYVPPQTHAPTYNPATTYTANPYSNPVVFCPRGLTPNPSLTACVPVQIPPNAHLSIWGNTYDCDYGYSSLGNACVPNSYWGQYPY